MFLYNLPTVSPEMPKTRRGEKPEGGRKRHGYPLMVAQMSFVKNPCSKLSLEPESISLFTVSSLRCIYMCFIGGLSPEITVPLLTSPEITFTPPLTPPPYPYLPHLRSTAR